MAAKVKPVKWAIGGDEPEDLEEFKDNDTIVKENKGLPTKGVYSLKVRRLYVKPNKNDDDRVGAMMVMHADKKEPAASYNGYLVRDGFNITEQGTPFLKRFLKGLGLSWDDFFKKSKEVEDGDRRELVQIGKVKFGTQANNDPIVKALLKESPADDWNDEPYMEVVRYIPADDAADEPSGGDEEAVDMGADEPVVAKAKKGKKGKAEPEVVEVKEDVLTATALGEMKPKALIALAEENGIKAKKVAKAGKDKEALVGLITAELNLPPF